MGQYFVVHGELEFKEPVAYNITKKKLLKIGALNQQGYFINADSEELTPEGPPNCNDRLLTMSVPYSTYHNFNIQALIPLDKLGWINACSNDGCFIGQHSINTIISHYDLAEWAKTNMTDEDRFEPKPKDYDCDTSYVENLLIWQSLVMDEFMSKRPK